MFNLKRRLLKELLIMKLEKQNGILDFLQQNRTEIKITCKMYVCVCVCACSQVQYVHTQKKIENKSNRISLKHNFT